MKKRITALLISICFSFFLAINASAATIGDVDCNGIITASDARLTLRFSARLEEPKIEAQKEYADINFDGKISAADARIILRIAACLDEAPQKPVVLKTMAELTEEEINEIINLAKLNCRDNYTNIENALSRIGIINSIYPTHIENREKYTSDYNRINSEYMNIYKEGQDYIASIDSQVEELKNEYKRKADSAGKLAYQNAMASGGSASSSAKEATAKNAYNYAYQNEYNKVNTAIDNLYATANIQIESYNYTLKQLISQLDDITAKIEELNSFIEKCESDYDKCNQVINDNMNPILDCIRYLLEESYHITDVPESNQELYDEFGAIAGSL